MPLDLKLSLPLLQAALQLAAMLLIVQHDPFGP
jgi:hypothetical protein